MFKPYFQKWSIPNVVKYPYGITNVATMQDWKKNTQCTNNVQEPYLQGIKLHIELAVHSKILGKQIQTTKSSNPIALEKRNIHNYIPSSTKHWK